VEDNLPPPSKSTLVERYKAGIFTWRSPLGLAYVPVELPI